KPEKGGTVFVFGTTDPSRDETLHDVLNWDASDGSNRRLLTAQNFDDERCYQLGDQSPLAKSRRERFPNPVLGQPGSNFELFCETDVQLPRQMEAGKPYTLYWVWQWPTAPGRDANFPGGRDEYYTSCIDVDVGEGLIPAQPLHPLRQQDPIPTAVSDFRSRTAITSSPLALHSMAGFGPVHATERRAGPGKGESTAA
ncbi:hypothetical protein BS50DRAFT_595350, partial [Corynespora cassiicola Philippines]